MNWIKTPQELDSLKEGKRTRRQSAEIFASFTMNKIDREIAATMSKEQLAAVYDALVGSKAEQQHTIDVRITIPLWFRRYYVVLLAGRDRRFRTTMTEKSRRRWSDWVFGLSMTGVAMAFLAVLAAIGAFFAAYWLKSELGIDIFPDKHLEDIIFDIVG